MPFASLGLQPKLVRAVEEEGYAHPTPIQQETIPLALEGRDIVGSAQTGTGKTAAFLLPTLQRLAAGRRGALRLLVLVPTRELAEQVRASAVAYGRHLHLATLAIYGGVGMQPQIAALRRGVDIVIATPGRLLDHMGRGHLDFSRLEVLVLDEADRMLDMGFAPDVRRILDALPATRQTLLFSATVSRDVDRLARRAMQGHAAVEIGRRATPAEGVEHLVYGVDKMDKRGALRELLRTQYTGRALVFTRTKHGADRLAMVLHRDGLPVAALHGGKAQSARTRTLEAFRSGKTRVLISTDIAARGIDVDEIGVVVNFDVPNDPEIYVHRVGRTARAGASGLAVTLMSPDEWLLMGDVEKLVGRTFVREVLPGFEPAVRPIQPRAQTPPFPPRQTPSIRGRTRLRRR